MSILDIGTPQRDLEIDIAAAKSEYERIDKWVEENIGNDTRIIPYHMLKGCIVSEQRNVSMALAQRDEYKKMAEEYGAEVVKLRREIVELHRSYSYLKQALLDSYEHIRR